MPNINSRTYEEAWEKEVKEFGFDPIEIENHMEIFNLKGGVIQSIFLGR